MRSQRPHATVARAALGDSDRTQSESLYASIYHAALMQGVQPETILQFLRVHAYETDFRRRTRSGRQLDGVVGEGTEQVEEKKSETDVTAKTQVPPTNSPLLDATPRIPTGSQGTR